jgi:hypothetical protein
MKTGEHVLIESDGRSLAGTVILASANGRSLMLAFEGIFDGCVGLLPVLQDEEGAYRSIITDAVVQLSVIEDQVMKEQP